MKEPEPSSPISVGLPVQGQLFTASTDGRPATLTGTTYRVVTVRELLQMHDESSLVEAKSIRRRGWSTSAKSLFVESILLGYPLTNVLLVDAGNEMQVIDGAQRLRALREFRGNQFALEALSVIGPLTGLFFSQLPTTDREAFLDVAVPITVVPAAAANQTYEIFLRLNSGGLGLDEGEIRAATLKGPFLDFVGRLSADETFVKLLDPRTSQLDDADREELLLRFFAFSERYRSFSHSVSGFINGFVADMNASFPRDRFENEFRDMVDYVSTHFPYGFRRSRADDRIPRIRFEAIAVGTNLAIRSRQVSDQPDMSWLESVRFRELMRTEASNSRVKVQARLEYVRDRLMTSVSTTD